MFRRCRDKEVDCPHWLTPAGTFAAHSRGINRYGLGDVQDFQFGNERQGLRESPAPLKESTDKKFGQRWNRNRQAFAELSKLLCPRSSLGNSIR